jgi:DTW domain-containing protein YfiP
LPIAPRPFAAEFHRAAASIRSTNSFDCCIACHHAPTIQKTQRLFLTRTPIEPFHYANVGS